MSAQGGSSCASTLLVFIPDRLSDLITKGEITERYYNPGNVFSEVHIVMFNDDGPEPAELGRTVGSAKLFLHNIPAGKELFVRTLGWRPWLLQEWAKRAVRLAETIRPALIRCHGAHLNAFAASRIKAVSNIPYVVSLHINPDEDVRGRSHSLLKRIVTHAQQKIEQIGLRNADLVMPVYRPIIPYLERLGVSRYEVCYNVLNPSNLRAKTSYALHDPVRIVSVGRQFREKDPEHLIRAVARRPGVDLTLIGDGSYHARLRTLVADLGVSDRVKFIPAMANDELCRQLPEFDIFAAHTEYWEISKSVLESLLTGLPVVINRRRGESVPELTPEICMLVDNSTEEYGRAIDHLIHDHHARESLGRAAFAHAQAHWAPAITEAKFAAIYRKVADLRE